VQSQLQGQLENWRLTSQLAQKTARQAADALEAWEIGKAVTITWALCACQPVYRAEQPWKLAKSAEQSSQLDSGAYSAAEATRLLAIFLSPYISASCNRILEQLGLPPVTNGMGARWPLGAQSLTRVVRRPVLYPRLAK